MVSDIVSIACSCSIVPRNISSRVALAYMNKMDLKLGSVVLAVLLVVIINGIVWSVV